jgi:U3 small nucleolar RNA-associated protein MPP10
MINTKKQFLEELLNPGKKSAKSANKLSTVKTQTNFSNLLAAAISELLNGDSQSNSSEELPFKSLDNLDPTQIWAMIENISKDHQNEVKKINENTIKPVVKELKDANLTLEYLNKKTGREENKQQEEDIEAEGDENLEDENEEIDGENFDEEGDADMDENEQENFFNFDDLNKFADEGLDEDATAAKNDDDIIDEEDDEANLDPKKAEEEKEYKYNDFFDAPDGKGKSLRKVGKLYGGDNENADIPDDDYIEDDIFDIENKMLKNKKEEIEKKYEFINPDQELSIEEIEKKMMSEKAWAMKGEVTSRERPKGSLVENFLDFETTVKPPPIPTPEYTDRIESIILLRIKDELFDDPIRKTVTASRKNEIELDFNKDKKGLAEIYEEEYEKNVLKLTSDTEISAAKKEIDELCAKVYTIFDKLTNNNFISGNRHQEMKVLTNVPSIQLEEISNYVTDNKSMAKSANEVFNKKDAETRTRDELSRDEKKTAHKNWKRNVRNKLREKVRNQKLNHLSKFTNTKFEAKLTMKQEKDKKMKQAAGNGKNSELKSSKFFSNLQKIASDDITKKKKRESGETDFGVMSSKPAKNYKL